MDSEEVRNRQDSLARYRYIEIAVVTDFLEATSAALAEINQQVLANRDGIYRGSPELLLSAKSRIAHKSFSAMLSYAWIVTKYKPGNASLDEIAKLSNIIYYLASESAVTREEHGAAHQEKGETAGNIKLTLMDLKPLSPMSETGWLAVGGQAASILIAAIGAILTFTSNVFQSNAADRRMEKHRIAEERRTQRDYRSRTRDSNMDIVLDYLDKMTSVLFEYNRQATLDNSANVKPNDEPKKYYRIAFILQLEEP